MSIQAREYGHATDVVGARHAVPLRRGRGLELTVFVLLANRFVDMDWFGFAFDFNRRQPVKLHPVKMHNLLVHML